MFRYVGKIPRAETSSSEARACVPTATRSYLRTVCVLFLCFLSLFSFVCLKIKLFEYFVPLSFLSLYGEYVVRFSLPGGVLIPCDHGLDI